MENEKKETSLRDILESGFARLEAEEQQDQAGNGDTPTVDAAHDPAAENETANTVSEEQVAQAAQQSAPADAVQQNTETNPVSANGDGSNTFGVLMQLVTALREENARLRADNQQAREAVNQQSALSEEAITKPLEEPQIPALNLRDLQYMSDEDADEMIAAWQNAVIAGAAAKAMNAADEKYSGLLRDREAQVRETARNSARSTISSRPEFSDFAKNEQVIERIAAFPEFQSMDPEKRYMFAALAARGMNHDPAAKLSVDEIVHMAMENPDVIKAIETKRAQEVRDKTNSLPVLTASSGMGGANAVPETRVKSREDLESRMRARFGL